MPNQISLGPDAQGRIVEKSERDGESALLRLPLLRERPGDLGSGTRKGGREIERTHELPAVPRHTPQRVIQVLPAPGTVDPHGLDVRERVGRDPHVLPGGRDHEIVDPLTIGLGRRVPCRIDRSGTPTPIARAGSPDPAPVPPG